MRRMLSHINKLGRLLRLLPVLVVLSVHSFAEGDSNEYNIKAMFILNFMKYIEWPATPPNTKFKIAVAGDSEIYEALVSMSNNRNEGGKVQIEKASLNSSDYYQIIIIPRSENHKVEEWFRKYQGKGVLIITEECKNCSYSAINLLNIDNKIRFEINNTQAKQGGIKISSRLADLAVSVRP